MSATMDSSGAEGIYEFEYYSEVFRAICIITPKVAPILHVKMNALRQIRKAIDELPGTQQAKARRLRIPKSQFERLTSPNALRMKLEDLLIIASRAGCGIEINLWPVERVYQRRYAVRAERADPR